MVYLYVFLALAVLGLLYMRFETTLVEVKNVMFTKSKNHLRILQLSDIHIDHLNVSSKRVNRIIDNVKPDLIIISGDFIDNTRHIPRFFKFLDDIRSNRAIYLCLGNHDYRAFKNNKKGLDKFIKDIETKGVNIMHNRSICYEKNSKKYNIIGIGDLRSGYSNLTEAFSSCQTDACMNIAFSHNPDIALEIPGGKVDYLFCGHFHGGQIWMPFDLEFLTLRSEKLCKMGIKRGLHKINGMNLYINRGLGNVLFPLRFLSRPEITVYYLP